MIFMQPIANKMFRVDGGLIFLHVDQEFPVKNTCSFKQNKVCPELCCPRDEDNKVFKQV